jgi:hypothetical protein
MSASLGARWWQFSLRGLLALVTVVALGAAWLAWRLERARNEDRAVTQIVEAGGRVAYANQFDERVSRLTPYEPKTDWAGGLCQWVFGADPFRRLVFVEVRDGESLAAISGYSLTGLEVLSLEGGDSVTDERLAHIRACERTVVLALGGTAVTDAGLEYVRGFKNLEELWLRGTKVTDRGLETVRHLKSLFLLDLTDTEVTDEGLATIASMESLSSVSLDSPGMTADGIRQLKKLPSLWSLWLGDDLSADIDLEVLSELAELADVGLFGGRITDEQLRAIANHPRIEGVRLQGCTALTDEALSILAEMPKLERLQLLGTTFSPKALNEFKAKRPKCLVY